jgi:hypothetical protein
MRSRVRRIQFKGTGETRDSVLPLLSEAGDVAVIERVRPRFIVIRCPCGCGENLFANLDWRAGPAWRLYRKQDKLSLFPSYWREDACESHFILWNDRLFWCNFGEGDDEFWSVDSSVEHLVFDNLPQDHFVNYAEVADKLGLIPWEALQACRQLELQGRVSSERKTRTLAFRRR